MFPDADGGIIVTTPQEASLSVCRKAVNFLRAVKIPVLGVVENMSGFICPHCGERTDVFTTGGGAAMAQEMDVPFLGSLPLAPEVVTLSDSGGPALGGHASAPIREAFEAVTQRVIEATRPGASN